MKRRIYSAIALLTVQFLSIPMVDAQQLATPQQQEACRIEATNLISLKERDLQNRLNAFLTSRSLAPLDMIMRSKQAIRVFEDDIDGICAEFGLRQNVNESLGQACDNRIVGVCTAVAEDAKERMLVATKQSLYLSSGRQHLLYMGQDINRITKAINTESRVLVLVDDLLRTVAQKINYFTDKIVQ